MSNMSRLGTSIVLAIMDRHELTIEDAQAVNDTMLEWCAPDFSECSVRELDAAIDEAHAIWKEGAAAYFARITALVAAGK